MKKENETNLIFMAYNKEHIEVFKASQSFKNVFSIFNNPIDSIDIENENEDMKLVKDAIEEYIKTYETEEGKITEYKCYMQF